MTMSAIGDPAAGPLESGMNVPDRAVVPLDSRTESRTVICRVAVWIIALAMMSDISNMKLVALRSWSYTSDLFTWDQVLQETLKGHFGLEYTYGNQFGDHAYLILLALLPLKFVLGHRMVNVLLLLGPMTACCAIIMTFEGFRRIRGPLAASMLALLVAFAPYGSRSLFENTYGCHFDTFSGYVLVALGVVLVVMSREGSAPSLWPHRVMAVFLTALFVSIKEEMAVLAVVFFAVCSLGRRRTYWAGLIGSLVSVVVGATFIVWNATPWNRGNDSLVRDALELGASSLAHLARIGYDGPLGVIVVAAVVLMITGVGIIRTIEPVAGGLFFTGITKLVFSGVVLDFDVSSWHNFPALVMLAGAVMVQFGSPKSLSPAREMWRNALAATILLLLLGHALLIEKPQLRREHGARINRIDALLPARQSIRSLKAHVDRSAVVAIAPFSAVEWTDGYRYSFHPRGITTSPQGIADFAVLGEHEAKLLSSGGEFQVLGMAGSDVLLKRTAVRGHCQERAAFIRYFGPEAIGATDRAYPCDPAFTSVD